MVNRGSLIRLEGPVDTTALETEMEHKINDQGDGKDDAESV